MDNSYSTLTLRDYPRSTWQTGIFFLALGLVPYFLSRGSAWIFTLVAGGIGLLILLTSTIAIVTADRSSWIVTLKERGLLTWKTREIPFAEIQAVEMQIAPGKMADGPNYRLVIIRTDGTVLPFRLAYTGGSLEMMKKARQLRAFLGVGGQDGRTGPVIETVR